MGITRLEHASPADIARLSAVLGEAFADYAWTRWTVDSERREARISAIQRLYLEHLGLPHGEVWADEVRTAVAVLLPPHLSALDPAPLTAGGAPPGGDTLRRGRTVFPAGTRSATWNGRPGGGTAGP